MNGASANGKLDSSKLEKIKEEIEKFAEIRSKIEAIVKFFEGKKDELSHIKDNITKLKLLKLDLWKLKVSINSDIMFAKIIEKIRKQFGLLKTEAEKELIKVECYISYLITNIKYTMKTLCSICCIIKSIRCKGQELNNLRNLKNTMDDLRIYLERLSHCINVLNELFVGLNGIIRILQKYVDKIIMIRDKIMVLRLGLMALSFIESFSDVLFSGLGGHYIIKYHTFHENICRSIKSALNTIEQCRFVLGITIFETKLAKFVVDCLVKQIKGSRETITEDIKNVESSIENIIICFLKCSNKSIILY